MIKVQFLFSSLQQFTGVININSCKMKQEPQIALTGTHHYITWTTHRILTYEFKYYVIAQRMTFVFHFKRNIDLVNTVYKIFFFCFNYTRGSYKLNYTAINWFNNEPALINGCKECKTSQIPFCMINNII